jgi:hypothetical protein
MENAVSAIEEGERLIADGQMREGLRKLAAASESIDEGMAYTALFERVRQTARLAAEAENGAWKAESAQLIELTKKRELSVYAHELSVALNGKRNDPTAVTPAPHAAKEPWYYRAASAVAVMAILGGVLSVIGGAIVGIELSKYKAYSYTAGVPTQTTHHHAVVIAYWIVIGIFTAVVWLALAVLVKFMADIARSKTSSRQ